MQKRFARRARANKNAGKNKKEAFLYDLLYFTAVLAIAGLFLNAWPDLRPDQSFEQREVAKQTAVFLNAMGAHADFYEWWVRIPDSVPTLQQFDIASTLKGLGFEEEKTDYGLALRARTLDLQNKPTVQAFLDEQARRGVPLAVSKSTLVVAGRTEVEIIPECVGWLGFFAITALILAYPRVDWRKRAIGLLVAWPILYAANLARLVTSIYAAFAASLPLFDFTHDVLWKASLLIVALLVWLVWVYFIVEEHEWKDFKTWARSFLQRCGRRRK